MASSDWNLLMDVLQRTPLSRREGQVVAAVARKTLGYRKASDRISASQIAAATGIARRHVTETLAQLEQRGVIRREGGAKGRAARLSIALAGPAEPVPDSVQANLYRKGARSKQKPTTQPVPEGGQEPVPGGGHTRGKGVNQPAAPEETNPVRRIFDAYLGAGGSLGLDRDRKALGRSARTLLDKGFELSLIETAAADLGREREFTGNLAKRVAEIKENGPRCSRGSSPNREMLTVDQLGECACAECRGWAEFRKAEAAA